MKKEDMDIIKEKMNDHLNKIFEDMKNTAYAEISAQVKEVQKNINSYSKYFGDDVYLFGNNIETYLQERYYERIYDIENKWSKQRKLLNSTLDSLCTTE